MNTNVLTEQENAHLVKIIASLSQGAKRLGARRVRELAPNDNMKFYSQAEFGYNDADREKVTLHLGALEVVFEVRSKYSSRDRGYTSEDPDCAYTLCRDFPTFMWVKLYAMNHLEKRTTQKKSWFGTNTDIQKTRKPIFSHTFAQEGTWFAYFRQRMDEIASWAETVNEAVVIEHEHRKSQEEIAKAAAQNAHEDKQIKTEAELNAIYEIETEFN